MLNVKCNFANAAHKDKTLLQCKQCPEGSPDTQQHLTVCSGLQHKNMINYDDLFDPDFKKVKRTLLEYQDLWEQKQILVNQTKLNI